MTSPPKREVLYVDHFDDETYIKHSVTMADCPDYIIRMDAMKDFGLTRLGRATDLKYKGKVVWRGPVLDQETCDLLCIRSPALDKERSTGRMHKSVS